MNKKLLLLFFWNHFMLTKEVVLKSDIQLNIQNKKVVGFIKKYNDRFGLLQSKHKLNYFIPEKYINQFMNGDKIVAKILYKKKIFFVEPLFLIKPFLYKFIGSIKKIGINFFIQPQYPLIKILFFCCIDYKKFQNIQNGDWFFAKLIHHKLNSSKAFHVYLLKCIARTNDNFLPWKVVLSNYNIDYVPCKKKNYDICLKNNLFRMDLTHLHFITIDNKDTKDIDDAVFLTDIGGQKIKMIVAISDPTSYISPGSKLDIIASKRLFTNYIPGLNIPMLPRELSEGIFSLHPKKKKPVLACEVYIDKYGNLSEDISFFLAWIKSESQLNYHDVSNWIQRKGSWKPDTDTANQLNLLHVLCNRRIQWRKKNALIFKDQPEYRFYFSKKKDVVKISMEHKTIANKMIEEAMIIANISAAKFLSKKLGFGIYNIHTGFHKINAKNISLLLKQYDINVHHEKIVTLIGFCKLYRLLEKSSNGYIEHRIRRYQSLGTMSITPKPHFGLGFKEYLTWTSPIRKYSDMINHRLLKDVILGNPANKPSEKILLDIINCKRRNQFIKKNVESWLYIKFFHKYHQCKKIFMAKIFDILPSGIKARLLINGANIFIPIIYITRIKNELICDQKNGILYFQNKELYRISNILSVIIIKVKILERLIIAKPFI
ncbi:exoribonuclease II [Buchnera aphidicola]|uniref:Exoribonuclease II n=1 Tax=Buchnera aphidicola (Sarucallis kahawaluokalani) TaxID=1241878 RepID=A0A4D6Y9C6_9GAMM|nr:exoribonuclease II [Buchnera aphidicola]QCI25979.1 exoribonuclease II [Buchnera aphidicola (Sarucallis kahawaluokalani)]